jgi:hypothetical protein
MGKGKDDPYGRAGRRGKKTDAVLRLLRGESLKELPRATGRGAPGGGRRDDFLAAGKQGLKGQRAERKIGQLPWRIRRCGWPPNRGLQTLPR